MHYTCRNCRHEVEWGWLPAASCGLLFFTEIAIAAFFILPLVHRCFPNGLGLWWFLGVPVVLILSILGGLAINYILEFAEWSLIYLHPCPSCRRRKWSWGFTRGFGL